MLTMYQQITIKTLAGQGKGPSEIAELVGCHRNTVAKVLDKGVTETQTRNRSAYWSPHQQLISDLLHKGLSKLRIWEILRDDHAITGSYSAFVKWTRDHVKVSRINAHVVQVTDPGEEAEIDFGYAGKFPLVIGEELTKVWVLVVTLSFSRQGFYLAVPDQKVETLIKALITGFEFFTGVPRSLKVDNLKAVILTNRRLDLEFNRLFLEFSLHYGFVIKPCTPRQPQQKGKVESGVGYVKKNFLAGRTFTDINDLNTQLKNWMINTANARTHGTTKQIPHQVFQEQERNHLQPLPENPFSMTPPQTRTVATNCHIQINNSYYSVPAVYVGQTVEARIEGNLVVIFHQGSRIATHALSSRPGIYVTNPSHYPGHKIYSQTQYQARYEEKMKAIGSHAQLFFKAVLQHHGNIWVRIIKKILGLSERYGPEMVDQACKRALSYGAYQPSVIQRICEQGLHTLEIEPGLLAPADPETQVFKDQNIKPVENVFSDQPTNHQSEKGQKKSDEDAFTRSLAYYLEPRPATGTGIKPPAVETTKKIVYQPEIKTNGQVRIDTQSQLSLLDNSSSKTDKTEPVTPTKNPASQPGKKVQPDENQATKKPPRSVNGT